MRFPVLLSASLLSLAASVSCVSAVAQQPTAASSSPWDGPVFHTSPAEVLKAAAAVTAVPQTNITVLLDERRIALDKDQRATQTYHIVYRIETQAGVQAWATIGAGYSPWFQKRPSLLARVVTEDQRVYTLDEKTLSDAPVHAGEEDMFDDDRRYNGPLPGLAQGAVVEEVITIEDTAPFFSTGSVYREYINRPFPVAMTRIVASAPASLALKYKVLRLPDVTAQKETVDGIVTLTFEKEHLDAVDHIAPNLPPDVAPVPEIEIATAASWKDVADRYRTMSDPQIHPEEAAAMLPKLARGDRQQRITAIVRELHHQVRYTGVEFGEAKLTPQPPAETMKRHYGDCKDKAALLVSMLRSAGIPAYLALLNAGEGQDVDPALPGMRLFDHAIVYVPGEKPEDPPLWIDATAEFAQVGELPASDRGRHALVIREGTAELTTIPAATPKDNLLVEHRVFTLAENGPAQVEERSETHGMVDEVYRARYGGAETKQEREELENYVRSAYSAEKLDKIDHSDGSDLSHPFELDLRMDKARRGFSSLQDAAVAIPIGGMLYRLPRWFFSAPPDANAKNKSEHDEESAREEASRTDDYVFEPFLNVWEYRVVPPLGFKVRELPSDQHEAMGPALLETHFSAEPDGTIVAKLTFDTVRGRYTPQEALALRQAIYARRNDESIMLRFVEGGAYELSQGHVKQALAVYQGLIAKHPTEALHHVQLAMALVQAGVGEQARDEAATGVKLEPGSALAFRIQGEVLSYDEVGRRFAAGMDRDGAIAAYKRSLEIEPDDAPTRWQLAVLLEFNRRGERYGKGSELDLAIAQYREAISRDKTLSKSYDENAMTDLFYAGKDAEALTAAHKLNSTATRNAVAIASATITGGSTEGIREAGRDAEDGSARSEALGEAGQLLLKRRKYALAADLFEASVHDAKDAPLRQRQVEIFRTLKPYEDEMLPPSDPRSAVQQFLLLAFAQDLNEPRLRALFSPVTLQPEHAVKHMMDQFQQAQRASRASAQREGLTTDNIADVIIGSAKFSVDGSDAVGYRVTATSMGADSQIFYVVRLADGYRIVSNDQPGQDMGNQVLAFLDAGNMAGAKQWLDWAREKLKRADGEDSLGGPLLPRFWDVADSSSAKPDASAMRIAAYALVASSDSAKQQIADIEKACASATADRKLDFDLLQMTALFFARDWKKTEAVALPLLQSHPRSQAALFYASLSAAMSRDKAGLQQAAEIATRANSSDPDIARVLAQAYANGYDYAQAQTILSKLVDEGKASANDYNSLAWLGLFTPPVTEAAVHAAGQANLLTKSGSFAILHTLACLYAVTGKSEQARQTLMQGMEADALEKPNSSVWFALGEIYEQYGLQDAALGAYRRVEPEQDEIARAEDGYVLAQKRIAALGAK